MGRADPLFPGQLRAAVIHALRDELAALTGAKLLFRMVLDGTVPEHRETEALEAIIQDLEREFAWKSSALFSRGELMFPDTHRVIEAVRAFGAGDTERAARELMARYGRGGEPVETFLSYPNF